MASRSPTGGETEDERREYLAGWGALTRLMTRGSSWSGHERNCAYLNLGDGSFADGSYPSGLDFLDDGRAVAVADWNDDGALDLWLRNRTGPQLRLLLNRPPDREWTSLWLEGATSNRDAVGAVVRLRSGDGWQRATVRAGDGYLSQSSRWVHFGLGTSGRVEAVEIRWPGGAKESIEGVGARGKYRIVQGTGRAVSVEPRPIRPADAPAADAPTPRTARVLLRAPLPMPPSLTDLLDGNGRATLINLWASWCAPCVEELTALAESYGNLHAAGLDVVALSVDAEEDRASAAAVFAERLAPRMQGPAFSWTPIGADLVETIDALLRHVLHRHDELKLPTSLLVDAAGNLQMIYVGPVDAAGLVDDLDRHVRAAVHPARRSLYPGRWYFRTPRPLPALAEDLRERGRTEDAAFYFGIHRALQAGAR